MVLGSSGSPLSASLEFLVPTVEFGGLSLRARIDTGADRSLISQSCARRLGPSGLVTFRDSKLALCNIAGEATPTQGALSGVLEWKGIGKEHEFWIVPGLPVPMLLGIDALTAWEAKIDFSRREVSACTPVRQGDIEEGKMLELAEKAGDQGDRLLEVFREFPELFCARPGMVSETEHRIETGDAAPIYRHPYPLSRDKADVVRRQVREMLDSGVIESSNSPWAAPVVLVPKKDGSSRFCVDYRLLNNVTREDRYPLPLIPVVLRNIGCAVVWSSLDLQSGYWQVKIAPEHRPKTAFITPEGLYQFRVMPFGLRNAPSSFQRMINRILRPVLGKTCECYLDDIVIYSPSLERHHEDVREVLGLLHRAGLTLKPEKCHFFQRELNFLGYHISGEGMRPQASKTQAVLDFPAPQKAQHIRQFLGLCSWHKAFIPHFSDVAGPLYALTKKKQRWLWGPNEQRAFAQLKELMTQAPVLGLPDETASLELYTDASDTGLGAELGQRKSDGSYEVLAYASRALRPPEKNYSVTEKECLALVWACDRLRVYLSRPFRVYTDHAALAWLQTKRELKGRLARWAIQLQEYTIQITPRKGAQMVTADALSRNPVGPPERTAVPDAMVLVAQCVSLEDIVKHQKLDPCYQEMVVYLETGALPLDPAMASMIIGRSARYRLREELLEFQSRKTEAWRTAIPGSLVQAVITEFHDPPSAGHLGFKNTYKKCRQRTYWPGQKGDIKKFVASCQVCQRLKFSQRKKQGLLKSTEVTAPGEMMGIDLMGPLPVSVRGNQFCLVLVDYYSKWVELFPLRRATATAIARCLVRDVFSRFGCPRALLSDNGPQFIGEVYEEVCSLFGIKRKFTSPYHPQTNLTERVNRTLGRMIASYVGQRHGAWDAHLEALAFALRTTTSETTGQTPARLFLGRELALPWDAMCKSDVWAKAEEYGVLADLVSSKVKLAQARQKRNYDKHREDREFDVGDLVWLRLRPMSSADHHRISKFMPRWRGPCRVIVKFSPMVYELQEVDTGAMIGSHNVVDLKTFSGRDSPVDDPLAPLGDSDEQNPAVAPSTSSEERDLPDDLDALQQTEEPGEEPSDSGDEFEPEQSSSADRCPSPGPRRSGRERPRLDYRRLAGFRPVSVR